MRIRGIYNRLLTNNPYLTQAVQAGLLMGAGDIITQKLIETKDINWKRTAQFSSVGFFIAGPTLRKWYGFLNNRFGEGGRTVAFKKMAADQFLFAPCFIAVLLSTFGAVQGLPFKENIKRVKHDYPDVLKNNYCLWPGVQIINFWLVPLNYQVLLVQGVSLIWNAYLSWKTHLNIDLKE